MNEKIRFYHQIAHHSAPNAVDFVVKALSDFPTKDNETTESLVQRIEKYLIRAMRKN